MTGNSDLEGKAPGPLPSFCLETLKQRREFKQAASGPRFSTPAFTMLRGPRASEPRALEPDVARGTDTPGLRFGFTVTRKVGNSVVRNRIRRRLREAVRVGAPHFPAIDMDLVILARREALAIEFSALVADIGRAVVVLASRGDRKEPRGRGESAPDRGKTGPS